MCQRFDLTGRWDSRKHWESSAEYALMKAEFEGNKHGRDPDCYDDCAGRWNGVMVNHVFCERASSIIS